MTLLNALSPELFDRWTCTCVIWLMKASRHCACLCKAIPLLPLCALVCSALPVSYSAVFICSAFRRSGYNKLTAASARHIADFVHVG